MLKDAASVLKKIGEILCAGGARRGSKVETKGFSLPTEKKWFDQSLDKIDVVDVTS